VVYESLVFEYYVTVSSNNYTAR